MTFTTAHLSVSLDGFVAGPDQTYDDPIGRGGMALHRWHFDADLPGHEVDARWADRILPPAGGAYVMGRNMYGPVRGEWSSYDDGRWRGWWGDDPPYHAPVFVLTHHEHEPIEMAGGTTFHFVTGGFDEALRLAREAGNGDVDVAGGASTVRQALAQRRARRAHPRHRPAPAAQRRADLRRHRRRRGSRSSRPSTRRWATHVRYRVGPPGGAD